MGQDMEMDSTSEVEVTDHGMMEGHGDHQDMAMSPMGHSDSQTEDDSQMVMMGSETMLISKDNFQYLNCFSFKHFKLVFFSK